MPRDLLVNQGANIVGPWTRVEPAGKKTWPFRVEVSGTFAADNVVIEELQGGLPTSNGPLPGNPGTVIANGTSQNVQTGTVVEIASVAAPQDVIINSPVEYIRARVGANATGTASVRCLEAE